MITSCLFICQLSTRPCVGIVWKTVFLFYGRQKCILWLLKWPTVVSNLTNFSRLRYTRVCHGLAWVQLVLVQDRKKNRKGKKSRFFYEREIIVTLTLLHSTRETSDLWSYQSQRPNELDTRWHTPGKRSDIGNEFWLEINIRFYSVF